MNTYEQKGLDALAKKYASSQLYIIDLKNEVCKLKGKQAGDMNKIDELQRDIRYFRTKSIEDSNRINAMIEALNRINRAAKKAVGGE